MEILTILADLVLHPWIFHLLNRQFFHMDSGLELRMLLVVAAFTVASLYFGAQVADLDGVWGFLGILLVPLVGNTLLFGLVWLVFKGIVLLVRTVLAPFFCVLVIIALGLIVL
jgi:hypothetical protein